MSRTGWKKAATLLSVLTEQERERILGQLDAVTAERLHREMKQIGSVPEKIADAIRTEFLFAMKKTAVATPEKTPTDDIPTSDVTPLETVVETTPENDETILPPSVNRSDANIQVQLFGSDGMMADYRIETDSQQMPGPHFPLKKERLHSSNDELGESDPVDSSAMAGEIFAQIASERSQSAAAVLSQLPDEMARLILERFDESKRKNIEERLARIGTIEPEAWEIVERTLDSVPHHQQGAGTAERE